MDRAGGGLQPGCRKLARTGQACHGSSPDIDPAYRFRPVSSAYARAKARHAAKTSGLAPAAKCDSLLQATTNPGPHSQASPASSAIVLIANTSVIERVDGFAVHEAAPPPFVCQEH